MPQQLGGSECVYTLVPQKNEQENIVQRNTPARDSRWTVFGRDRVLILCEEMIEIGGQICDSGSEKNNSQRYAILVRDCLSLTLTHPSRKMDKHLSKKHLQ